ncbi:unnamed protein product [Bursaphelenchus xylophilus]|uniref:(pine wood nematode) hypothetical protein n=1 Tax=Bursaphelenchus xylophilus TaxID=6326 RepID=A0A1I7SFQ5_BURXY|nr:unnamed protein product [Bursaphelenchus xylophilus]CAG9123681.1 unnamed protein product [Bursaphelenchus xylophilus]
MLLLTMAIMVIGVLSSRECDHDCSDTICPSLDCNQTSFVNDCDCCPQCLRFRNEKCGDGHGQCVNGLECVNLDRLPFGVCQNKILTPRCDPELCDSSVPVCTEDSHLVLIPPSDNACCPKAQCECDYATCETLSNKCPNNTKRYLMRKGGNNPGMCCDQFECRQPAFYCGRVRCSLYRDLDLFTECPGDSYRPQEYIPQGSCCPIFPECQCKGSVCPPVRCGKNEKVVMIRRGTQSPGACCDIFQCLVDSNSTTDQSCFFEGKTYASGDNWHYEPCQTCWCNNGVSMCTSLECPSVARHCSWIEIPDGECCPICRGCIDDLGKHKVNESWAVDGCTNCTCSEDFKIQCQKSLCSCDGSERSNPCCLECPGEETCPNMDHCDLRCIHGLKRDAEGCEECICASENPKEDVVLYNKCNDQSPCERHCFNGFSLNDQGCYTCECKQCPSMEMCLKKCLFGYQINHAGCSICKCKAGGFETKKIETNNISDLCHREEKEYRNGDWWSESCRQCLCLQGRTYCSALSCMARDNCSLSQYNIKDGECCPSCGEFVEASFVPCHFDNVVSQYVDGEMFRKDCAVCICALGHVLCSEENCDKEYLNNSFPDDKAMQGYQMDCIDYKNRNHGYHSVWSDGICRHCQCQLNGSIACVDIICPEVKCDGKLLHLENQCCPVCFEHKTEASCDYNDVKYYQNEVFSDGLCRNCTCTIYGNVECNTTQCMECERPIYTPFECCPTCAENVLYSSKVETEVVIFDNGHLLNVYYISFAIVGCFVILLFVIGKFLKRYYMTSEAGKSMKNGYKYSRDEQTLHPLISRSDTLWSRSSNLSSVDSHLI